MTTEATTAIDTTDATEKMVSRILAIRQMSKYRLKPVAIGSDDERVLNWVREREAVASPYAATALEKARTRRSRRAEKRKQAAV